MKIIKPVVAIFHPRLVVGGGSEAAAIWICQALKDDYSVRLITLGKVDLDELNKSYGTTLMEKDLQTIELPIPKMMSHMFDALRIYRVIRYGRKNRSSYDVMISGYNPMDFGVPGIQYIGDLTFDDHLRHKLDTFSGRRMKIYHMPSPFRSAYRLFSRILSGQRKWGWKDNLTVANSEWTRRIMKEHFEVDSTTIYPSIIGDFPEVPFKDREDGFVCIGRLVPEKRIHTVIEILKGVREKGWPFHLHIIGRPENRAYTQYIQKLCRENSEWLFYEGEVYGAKKNELISQHKYGISGRENEPFGITVAEYVKAGCLVWVPFGGGQIEIVDHLSLVYKDIGDAVNKIISVSEDQKQQELLLDHLKLQSEKFSTQMFVDKTRKVVKNFLSHQGI